MFSFLNYVYEIFTVSRANGVDIGVAYDMFRTDVREGRALEYNTGAALPDFDFAAAQDAWDALADKEQEVAYEEWHSFKDECYFDVCAAFEAGVDAVVALVSEWREGREAATDEAD